MDEIAHINTKDYQTFKLKGLIEHLYGTADFAFFFAGTFNNAEWRKLLGLWHDLGKYSDEFQEYIK
jgi:CRISPR-associated endonuclease/helicase Cas3